MIFVRVGGVLLGLVSLGLQGQGKGETSRHCCMCLISSVNDEGYNVFG